MTQEQKLQMYSAYLPYKLYVSQPRHGINEAYLLYGLKYNSWAKEWTAFIDDSRHGDYRQSYIKGIKPILRPMSDLTKEIVHEGETIIVEDIINNKDHRITYSDSHKCLIFHDEGSLEEVFYDDYPYWIVEILLKYHFNYFNLPEREYIVKE